MYLLELAGEDDPFAAAEAAAVVGAADVFAPGLARAPSLPDRARRLAFTGHAGPLVATAGATVPAAREALAAAPLDRSGSVAVRARDVRGTAEIDSQRAERALGSALVERGFAVDLDSPDHVLVAAFAGETCALAWRQFETDGGYGDRAPTDRPFFQPGSMGPRLARALVHLAGGRPGSRLLDPMCGTGGVLIEAGLVGARPVGTDAQRKMVRGARENLQAFVGEVSVARADATRLPFRDDSVDAAVFDAPYGRQSKVVGDPVSGALGEVSRVAPRAVLVANRSWEEAARAAGWTVENRFERRVHRSLVRHVHVLA